MNIPVQTVTRAGLPVPAPSVARHLCADSRAGWASVVVSSGPYPNSTRAGTGKIALDWGLSGRIVWRLRGSSLEGRGRNDGGLTVGPGLTVAAHALS